MSLNLCDSKEIGFLPLSDPFYHKPMGMNMRQSIDLRSQYMVYCPYLGPDRLVSPHLRDLILDYRKQPDKRHFIENVRTFLSDWSPALLYQEKF